MGRPPLPLGTWGKISRTEVSPGRWRARAQYRDFDGVTRPVERFANGKTGAAAERALVAALRDRAAPARGDTIDRDTTIDTLARLWIAEIASDGQHTTQTIDRYQSAIDVHVLPALGNVRLSEISVGLLDRFLKARKTPATAKQCRVVLTGMLGLAARHDVIEHNPVRETSRRTAPRKPVRAMTVAEVAALRAVVADWSGGNQFGSPRGLDLPEILDVMLGTGVRIGEVLAIRRADVDLAADPPTVTITGTIVGGRQQAKPKTDSSRRQMILPSFAAAALRRQIGRDLPTDDDLVFPSRTGGPRSTNNVRRQLREARTDAFDWVTPHVFRKTVATAVERSADIETAAAQLGHSGPTVTRVHYVEKTATGPDVRHVLDEFSPVSRGFSVGETG
jgi:integrase